MELIAHDTNLNTIAAFRRLIPKVDFDWFLKIDFMSS